MAFEFPDLTQAAGVLRLVACGRIVTGDKSLSDWLNKKGSLISSYTVNQTRHYVRVLLGEPPENHFHVEIALRGIFAKDALPKSSHKIGEVRSTIAKILDQKLDIRAYYDLKMPFNDLPESSIIRLLSVEAKVGEVGIALQGGTLAVSGSPVDRILWTRSNDKERCTFNLVANIPGCTAHENYLVELQHQLQSLFEFHILGKESPIIYARVS